jgi:tRNA threonylcarbamoyladenosine biosynthesis protein TsaE
MNKILDIEYPISRIDALASNLLPLIKSETTYIGLRGDLGAGKTTFTRAFCKAQGCTDTVSSPSYTLENQYEISSGSEQYLIRHWDLYRVNEFDEILEDILEPLHYGSRKTIVILEWYERCTGILTHLDYVFELSQSGHSHDIRNFSLYSEKKKVSGSLISTIAAEFAKKVT